MVNNLRSKLSKGVPSIGSWMQLPNSSVAEIMGRAGYDWVTVDLEHGTFSTSQLPDIFRALELGGTLPMARVAQVHPKDIKYVLDAGAKGIILPMIETGKQLEQAISWTFYPPKGTRGVGFSRANLFGKDFSSYASDHSEDILIVAQIEHVNAIDNADEILSVKGLDRIIIGPYDLSGSMGLTAQFDHPQFFSALDKIKDRSKQFKIPLGINVVMPEPDKLKKKIQEGYLFIAYGIDAVFLFSSAENPMI